MPDQERNEEAQPADEPSQLLSVESEVFDQALAGLDQNALITPDVLNALQGLLIENTEATANDFLNALRAEPPDEGS